MGVRYRHFNPRAPCGARRLLAVSAADIAQFQSTRPVWGATPRMRSTRAATAHFNPRAPCGARPRQPSGGIPERNFNPRAPCGARLFDHAGSRSVLQISIHAPRVGRDVELPSRCSHMTGISIHAPRVGRDRDDLAVRGHKVISIHAPRVGRDGRDGRLHIIARYFNPRAPCGARPSMREITKTILQFQSTRPVWGATKFDDMPVLIGTFQSTRPVWGATSARAPRPAPNLISIHAPRVGRDLKDFIFNIDDICISIHAPRVGRDFRSGRNSQARKISIHAPRVGRDVATNAMWIVYESFQSTRPVWGATCSYPISPYSMCISIHAPRVGRDDIASLFRSNLFQFQSTRPVWGATWQRRL